MWSARVPWNLERHFWTWIDKVASWVELLLMLSFSLRYCTPRAIPYPRLLSTPYLYRKMSSSTQSINPDIVSKVRPPPVASRFLS